MGAPSGARLLADLMTMSTYAPNPFSPGRRFDVGQHGRGERMVI
jgi:hypothetical protein